MKDGQDIVKEAFDKLTPEDLHDVLQDVGVHYLPCEICEKRRRERAA